MQYRQYTDNAMIFNQHLKRLNKISCNVTAALPKKKQTKKQTKRSYSNSNSYRIPILQELLISVSHHNFSEHVKVSFTSNTTWQRETVWLMSSREVEHTTCIYLMFIDK